MLVLYTIVCMIHEVDCLPPMLPLLPLLAHQTSPHPTGKSEQSQVLGLEKIWMFVLICSASKALLRLKDKLAPQCKPFAKPASGFTVNTLHREILLSLIFRHNPTATRPIILCYANIFTFAYFSIKEVSLGNSQRTMA